MSELFFEEDSLLDLESIVKVEKPVLNKNSINMFPNGIDWTKENLLLYIRSSESYLYPNGTIKPTSEGIDLSLLTEHYFTIGYEETSRYFGEFADCGDYLSYKEYVIPHPSATSEYFKRFNHGLSLFSSFIENLYSYSPRSRIESYNIIPANIDAQIRFYKDKQAAVVVRFDFEDDTSRYFCINPKLFIYENLGNFDDFVDKRGDRLNIITNYELDNQKVFVEIESEKAIEFYKGKLPFKGNVLSWICYSIYSHSSNIDVCDVMGERKCVGYTIDYSLVNPDIINNFYDINSADNVYVKEEFDKRVTKRNPRGWDSRDISLGITNIYLLSKWIGCNGTSVKSAITKKEYIDEVLPTFHFSEEENKPIWERRDDNIIVTLKCGTNHQVVFMYNTTTKTRKVIDVDGTNKQILIPSLRNGILRLMKINKTPVLWNDVSLNDLFKGTNVEWILNNTTAFDPEFKFAMQDTSCNHHYYKLADKICENDLGQTPIAILATTGTPVLEQLLKNKLFNLYFATLDNLIDPYSMLDSNAPTPRGWRHSRSKMNYNGGESSLKKMFKMTLDQLKYIDSHITVELGDCYKNTYKIPGLKGCLELIGCESFNVIDLKTFTSIIDISVKMVDDNNYYGDTFWERTDRHWSRVVSVTETMNVKQKLEFLMKYHNVLEEYGDYLNMRTQLKDLQDSGRLHETVFSDSWYPLKPGNATKFVYYRPGEEFRANEYPRYRHMNVENFISVYIPEHFGNEARDNFEFVYEGKNLMGAVIKIDAVQHVKLLHDEITTWFNLYEDEAEKASFNEALSRVRPFEWDDDESGLAIISPKDPADLKHEGEVNSFCVGGFVKPISEGTTNVMFIRRKDMMDASYFCVELVKESEKYFIRQCHCYRNHNLSFAEQDAAGEASGYEVYNKHFDICKFLIKWAKHFKEEIDYESVKDSYSALCAHR